MNFFAATSAILRSAQNSPRNTERPAFEPEEVHTRPLAWPLADLSGHGWPSLRVAGLAPDPTAAFTLGLLLLTRGRTPVHLAVIPLLWIVVAGATAWILAIPQDLALPLAGLCGFALVLWKNRRQTRA